MGGCNLTDPSRFLMDGPVRAREGAPSAGVAEFGKEENPVLEHGDGAVLAGLAAPPAAVAGLLIEDGHRHPHLRRSLRRPEKKVKIGLLHIAVHESCLAGQREGEAQVRRNHGLPRAPFPACDRDPHSGTRIFNRLSSVNRLVRAGSR